MSRHEYERATRSEFRPVKASELRPGLLVHVEGEAKGKCWRFVGMADETTAFLRTPKTNWPARAPISKLLHCRERLLRPLRTPFKRVGEHWNDRMQRELLRQVLGEEE